MNEITELSKQDIILKYNDFLTAGDIKEFIKKYNIPDNAKVLIQRIEDKYYNENHWGVYYKNGFFYNDAVKYNKDFDDGIFMDKEQYPQGDQLTRIPDEALLEMREQYHPAWSCVYYKDDPNILFIDLHY